MKKNQIINPLIRFRRKAQGRYANNLGGAYGRAVTVDDQKCFYVTSAEIGNPNPEETVVCFNVAPDETTCGVISPGSGFYFFTNGDIISTQSYIDAPTERCLRFQTKHVSENDGISPDDDVTFYYTQGTCHKDGDSDPECLLEEYADAPVRNSMYGYQTARVGDRGDDIVTVLFDSPLAVVGLNWQVVVNSTAANIIGTNIDVDGVLELTIDVQVISTDNVQISHTAVTNGAQAANGKMLYQFWLDDVVNSVGVDFWIMESGDFWLNETPGGWQLET